MTLKIALKPGEPVFIGNAKLRVVSQHTCVLLIEGNAPVLRSEDAIAEDGVEGPLEMARLALQEMYLAGDLGASRERFKEMSEHLLEAQPDLAPILRRIHGLLRCGLVYQAVKEAKALSAPRPDAAAGQAAQSCEEGDHRPDRQQQHAAAG